MSQRLSEKRFDALPRPKHGNRIFYDGPNSKGKDWTPGFGLRVTAGGALSFVLNYRTKSGRERRITIGSPPVWSLAAARVEAASLKRNISLGDDPLGKIKSARHAPSMSDLCDRFIEEQLPQRRPNTRSGYTTMINNFVKPEMGAVKVSEISFTDVDRLHRKLSRGKGNRRPTPYTANRVLALLSRMFNLAIRWGWRADNPAKGVERNQEHRRERYLSGDELIRISKALAEHEDREGVAVIQLLMLTGARRMEVLSATWDQFDLQAGLWTKPAAQTKQKKVHRVPLSAPARQILADLHKSNSTDGQTGFLFPSRIGTGHRVEVRRTWHAVCCTAAVVGCRLHDLRHSYASFLASAGHSLPIIGALLGHTQAATTARYAHLLDDPLRRATERIGVMIAGEQSDRANVVRLRGRS